MNLDILSALGPVWTWVLIGLILMGAELAISGVFLVWLGIAAMITGLETALVPMPWQAQILFFAGLSVGLVILAQKRMAGRPNSLNRGANGLIGQEFRLDTAITEGVGRIRVNDTVVARLRCRRTGRHPDPGHWDRGNRPHRDDGLTAGGGLLRLRSSRFRRR